MRLTATCNSMTIFKVFPPSTHDPLARCLREDVLLRSLVLPVSFLGGSRPFLPVPCSLTRPSPSSFRVYAQMRFFSSVFLFFLPERNVFSHYRRTNPILVSAVPQALTLNPATSPYMASRDQFYAPSPFTSTAFSYSPSSVCFLSLLRRCCYSYLLHDVTVSSLLVEVGCRGLISQRRTHVLCRAVL